MKRLMPDYKPGEQGLNKVLGNLESEIMDIIWQKDCEVSIRDIFEVLAARRKIAYTTVMTIMGRLAEKKILSKRIESNVLFFVPTMTREEFTDNVVGDVVDSLLEDFADATVARFINHVKENDRDTIERLEKMLASYREGEV